jgi:hypothetical protein
MCQKSRIFASNMRYIVLPLIGVALAYGQCNMCAPNPASSPRPYGFNPAVLWLPPATDTSLTIYFTFPDTVRYGTLIVYPNYAIWVDSLRLDRGLITTQGGGTFAYNASNPSAGPIIFDQLHRYKQWGSGTTDYANFVVYQNPGTSAGPAGGTPPIGCARLCIRTSSTTGSDTLRMKVRVFVTTLGDADNKDTTNLRPILLGSNAWFDTTFRYPVVVHGGRCNRCAPNAANSPFPHGFSPDPLYLPPGIDTSLTIYFTFPDQVQQGSLTFYPNYAIWVDSLRLDRGLITTQDGLTFAYNASDPWAGPIIFDQPHRYKQWGSGPTDYANFVVYQNPGTSAGPPGQTPPIGCARVCIRTSATEGSDTLRIKVRVFVPALGDVDNKDTTNLRPILLGSNAWFDTTFRYPVVVRGRCNRCTPNLFNSPFPYGFNPDPLYLPPGIDTSLTIHFTFPDEVPGGGGSFYLYPNYAIWVDSLRLDRGLITDQYGNPFAYNASNPAAGAIHFDQPHRYKQWGSGATDYANFVVYQNPGTPPGGQPGSTPPIGCARVCIRTSATTGSDTLRMKVRVFVPSLGDRDNKDTTNLRPTLWGFDAWFDTTFRYAVVISSLPASLGHGMSAMYAFRPVSNPAYREAVVTYTLPQPMAVRLRAYTLDGREVLLRDLGLQPAGTFQETMNLPAGQYFLRLETPYGLSATRLAVIE